MCIYRYVARERERDVSICIYIYICTMNVIRCVYTCIHICIYIYIYIYTCIHLFISEDTPLHDEVDSVEQEQGPHGGTPPPAIASTANYVL